MVRELNLLGVFSTSKLTCCGFEETVCITEQRTSNRPSKGPGTVSDGLWDGGTVVWCDGQIPMISVLCN